MDKLNESLSVTSLCTPAQCVLLAWAVFVFPMQCQNVLFPSWSADDLCAFDGCFCFPPVKVSVLIFLFFFRAVESCVKSRLCLYCAQCHV